MSRTEHCLGSATAICNERTLFRYYRNFLDESRGQNFIAAMRDGRMDGQKFYRQMFANKIKITHSLKVCAACMEHDFENIGWTYWHIQHQYPGVWICHKHGLLLREAARKINSEIKHQWRRPSDFIPIPVTFNAQEEKYDNVLARLTTFTIDIVDKQPGIQIDLNRLHLLYRAVMKQRYHLTRITELGTLGIATSSLCTFKG